jgi:hypothetical protein
MAENKTSSISKAGSNEKMGEFWDTHDFTDFDKDVPDVEYKVMSAVPVELDLLSLLENQANLHGVTVETLVNLWLQQKLVEQKQISGKKRSTRRPRSRDSGAQANRPEG